jgi:hypothetical protein
MEGPMMGKPPTGEHYQLTGAFRIDFATGKIRRIRSYWDTAAMAKKLGLMASSDRRTKPGAATWPTRALYVRGMGLLDGRHVLADLIRIVDRGVRVFGDPDVLAIAAGRIALQ